MAEEMHGVWKAPPDDQAAVAHWYERDRSVCLQSMLDRNSSLEFGII